MLLVWQDHGSNEWASAIGQILTVAPPRPPTPGPDPFSLADPAITEGVLTAAGFTEVTFIDVHEPVFHGPDSTTAFDAVPRLWEVQDLLGNLEAAAAEQARARLRATLDAHSTDGGVWFDSRAWIVTARRIGEAEGAS